MKVLVVDDEPAMLLAMKRLLSGMEGVEIVGSFRNAAEVLDFVKSKEVDLAFLDIKIAADDGVELARSLRSLRGELDIVFTTSHTDFALHAYDVYPLDYMVKPISGMRLAQTIDRARGRRSAASDNAGGHTANRLTIRGLGCFEASSKQAGPVKWLSKKSMELFAYLLVHRGRSAAKSRILEELFPNMPQKNAEMYLHTAVYQLRKALSPHGFKEMVISAHEQYRLDLDQADVDFIQLEQGVESYAEFTIEREAEAIELEKRFAGELFEDKSFGWATLERERVAMMYASFAKRLASWLLAGNRWGEAAQIAKKIVARNEFEEESSLLLMHIYAAMGDRQSLHSYYKRYTRLLHQELGLQPSLRIQQLYGQWK
ncbi:Two-component response regulator, SAPR family, consists of REC, wHTH and BTAD domains [Paenibacillus sp. UNCCL117]|uniref:response regulator n=1 Tax=unclassified Paenibacillus TaxID=185978 RepID=UPI000886AB18|nr:MULTISPECIES: response regulator [unclassified Paenibacillus]SDD70433.1 Two-component response regulator, SAPR family, consists of REC, wHTH and BTAD domains [Paenibacillus sp. cl123]SFW45339.1 Two-component response regulator, SAPR family, consists of REC, wHTH and BTAD domains [Paenibacillus sp. UNCCL117]